MVKKGTPKRGKNGKNMDLSICIFVAFFFAFSICFFLLLFCFFFLLFCCFLPGKKQNKSKTKAKQKQKKANRKSKKKATKMQMDKSMFFPFFPLFVSFFSPFILLLCFLDFADLLFGFSIFLSFSRFFSSLKKKRISYGLVNIMPD